ncbi:MAG: 30S ribosome-binding factor RbfA [Planctomycetota bacterium]
MRAYRIEKLASTIREIVGHAIATRLKDPRISPLASVTRVEVSGDLMVARVYVSVLGEAGKGRATLGGLNHAVGHVQRLVAKQLPIRRCPEIRFVLDESLKKAAETMRLIDESVGVEQYPAGEAESDADRRDEPDHSGGAE